MKGTDSKKVLLMGRSGSGKTSMRSIIFADYLASDTTRLSPTIDVEYSHVRFLGDLHLHLWDCGGQDEFFRSYLSSKRDHIFKSVELLIYVFDVSNNDSEERDNDMREFCDTLNALEEHSPEARVFALIHKMDLIREDLRPSVFAEREKEILGMGEGLRVECFVTSIWDETLYRAWSNIVYSLLPNMPLIETRLTKFCQNCGADEVVIFESATFLVIAQAANTASPHPDNHRFEKISNIIKQFKLSCRKAHQAQFESMQVQTEGVSSCVFAKLTENTTIMVVASDPHVYIASFSSYIDDLTSEISQAFI